MSSEQLQWTKEEGNIAGDDPGRDSTRQLLRRSVALLEAARVQSSARDLPCPGSQDPVILAVVLEVHFLGVQPTTVWHLVHREFAKPRGIL
jgi:hypothetical protein